MGLLLDRLRTSRPPPAASTAVLDRPSPTPGPLLQALRASRLRIGAALPLSTFGRVKRLIQAPLQASPEESIARAQNILSLSRVTGLRPSEAERQFDTLRRRPEITGIRTEPSAEEMLGLPVTAGIMAGAIANPTIIPGLIAGTGAAAVVTPVLKAAKRGILPPVPSEIASNTLDLLEFAGQAALFGKVAKATPEAITALTKRAVTTYKLPRTITIDAAKIRSIFQTGDAISPTESELVRGLGLTGSQYRTALQRGVMVEVPTEKVIQVTDRPWWAKLKQAIRVPPSALTTTVQRAGGVRQAPAGALPAPSQVPPPSKVGPLLMALRETRASVSPPNAAITPTTHPATLEKIHARMEKIEQLIPQLVSQRGQGDAIRALKQEYAILDDQSLSLLIATSPKSKETGIPTTPVVSPQDPRGEGFSLLQYEKAIREQYQPVVKRKVIVAKSIVELLQDDVEAAKAAAESIESGQAGRRARTETGEWFGIPSTFPDYFKNKGYTKKESLAILSNILEGKPITEKQKAIALDLIAGSRAQLAAEKEAYDAALNAEREQARVEGHPPEQISQAEIAGQAAAQGELEAEGVDLPPEATEFDPAKLEAEVTPIKPQLPGAEPTLPPRKIQPPQVIQSGGGTPVGAQGLAEPQTPQAMASSKWQVNLPKDPTIKQTISKTQIIDYVEREFGVPVRGKLTHTMQQLSGFYKIREQIIRLKKWGELEPLTHEVAHHIDNLMEKGLSGAVALKRGRDRWYKDIAPPGMKKAIVKELADLDYNPKERRTEEGFAEYIRHFVTDTGEAPVKAPVFHKAFQSTFLPKHSDLQRQLEGLRQLYRVWKEQGALNRVLGQIDFRGEHTERPFLTKVRKAIDTLTGLMVDEFYVLRQVEQQLGLKPRVNIRPTESPSEMATYMKQKSSGIARTFVETAAIDEYGNVIGPSLVDILKPIPRNQLKNFIAYWVSRRALHLESRRSIESGFDINDAKAIIDTFQNPTWDRVTEQLTGWSNHTVNWMVRAGGLSQEVAEVFRILNPIYAPFQRAFMDDLQVIRGAGKVFSPSAPFKRIRGSGRPILNPMQTMVQQLTQMIGRAHRIRLANLIVDLSKREGAGGIVDAIPLARTPTTFKLEQIHDQLRKAGYELVKGGEVRGELLPGTGIQTPLSPDELDELMTVFSASAKVGGKDNVVAVFRWGKLHLYELHPDLYRALQGLEPIQLGGVMQVLSMFTRLLRLGATGLNATFGLVRNPIKDALTFTTFSKKQFPTPADPLIGVALELLGKPGSFAFRFKVAGGDISSMMGYDRAQVMSTLDDALLKNLPAGKVLKIVKHPIDTLRRLMNIPEMGPRIAEGTASLVRYLKQHPEWTPEDAFVAAFNDAQDITINFSRSGTLGKQVNQAVFAFNASIQGLNKFYRELRGHPARTILRGMAWISLAAIAFWYRNKDEEWYKNLDPRYKFNNIFIELDNVIVRLPIPYDIGVLFAALPVAVLDANYHKATELYHGLIDIALSQVPFPMPDIIGPVWDVAANKNYLGNPIESLGMRYKPVEERTHPYTSPYARWLSRGFVQMGIKLSPVQIEHLVNNYTGGLVRTVGRPFRGIKEAADLPIIGSQIQRFPEKPTLAIDRYYNRLQTLREGHAVNRLTPREESERRRLESFDRTQMRLSRDRLRKAQADENRGAMRREHIFQSRSLKQLGFGLDGKR